jgi:hypothetical protein
MLSFIVQALLDPTVLELSLLCKLDNFSVLRKKCTIMKRSNLQQKLIKFTKRVLLDRPLACFLKRVVTLCRKECLALFMKKNIFFFNAKPASLVQVCLSVTQRNLKRRLCCGLYYKRITIVIDAPSLVSN